MIRIEYRKRNEGGSYVDKADLLDEIRLEVGDLIDKHRKDLPLMFQKVCHHIQSRVEDYQGIAVYLTEYPEFIRRHESGSIGLPRVQKFGEGPLSITAVRGGLYRERNLNRILICIPLYLGQNIYGIFVVESNPLSQIHDEDITLFTEVCSSFENRMIAYYQPDAEEPDFFDDDLV